jgi:hypothetical protein
MTDKHLRDDHLLSIALADYDVSRQGIANYDEYLFTIRSWNIATTGILLGGYLGLNINTHENAIPPGIAILAQVSVGICFWLLDSFNKSLQMVHIFNSRSVEAFLGGVTHHYSGPITSRRFEVKERHHLRPTIKNLVEESVWPFYLVPMAFFAMVVSSHATNKAQCMGASAGACSLSPDAWFAFAAAALVASLIGFSILLRFRSKRYISLSFRFPRSFRFSIPKRFALHDRHLKAQFVYALEKELETALNIAGHDAAITKSLHYGPYKAQLSIRPRNRKLDRRFVICVDMRKRAHKPGFNEDRHRALLRMDHSCAFVTTDQIAADFDGELVAMTNAALAFFKRDCRPK